MWGTGMETLCLCILAAVAGIYHCDTHIFPAFLLLVVCSSPIRTRNMIRIIVTVAQQNRTPQRLKYQPFKPSNPPFFNLVDG